VILLRKVDDLGDSLVPGTAQRESANFYPVAGFLKRMLEFSRLTGMYTTAMQHFGQSRYVEAEAIFNEIVPAFRQVLGPHHIHTLSVMNSQVLLWLKLGRHESAVELARQLLADCEQFLGPHHLGTAAVVNSLALCFLHKRSEREAEPLFLRAWIDAKRLHGENDLNTLGVAHNLATVYLNQARYDEAEDLYKRTLEARARKLGPSHPITLESMDGLGVLYATRGDYIQAESLLQRCLTLRQEVLGPHHADYLNTLINIAELYVKLARYQEAEDAYQRALRVCSQLLGPDHPQTLAAANDLGKLYTEQELYGIGRPQPVEHDLFVRAEELFLRAYQGRQRVLGTKHPLTLHSMNNLGVLYRAWGRLNDAEVWLSRSFETSREVHGYGHPDTATAATNLASVYIDRGRVQEAYDLYDVAAKRLEELLGGDHPNTLGVLNHFARVCTLIGRPAAAFEFMERVQLSQTRTLIRRVSISSAEEAAIAIGQAEADLHTFISLVWRELRNSVQHVRATADIVLRRKALGQDASAAQREALLGGRYPELEPQIRVWIALRNKVTRETLAGPADEENAEQHGQKLQEWEKELEQRERALARQIPEVRLEEKLRTLDRQTVALLLPKNSTLIEFLRFNVFNFKATVTNGETLWESARYVAFVVPAGQPDAVQMIDLGEAEPIDKMVRTFRELLGREAGEDMWDVADKLREAVVDPLLGTGENQRIFLATDGELNLLPFEVLCSKSNKKKLLIDEHQFSYLGTGRDLIRLREKSAVKRGTAVIAADPAFELSEDGSAGPGQTHSGLARELEREGVGFPPLPGTRIEGERIARLLQVKPWMDKAVLDKHLKLERSPWILHAATHGYFLSDQETALAKMRQRVEMIAPGMKPPAWSRLQEKPLTNPMLRSGLALAGSQNWLDRKKLPEEAEDGLLTAEDVSLMDLRGTELVVLSACQTGLGAVRHGEGVFGLRRGFVIAGARTLVMSLWKVDDLAAVILMNRFYENLLERKMGRGDALREAQQYLRKKITIGTIREEWLNDEMIEKLAGGNMHVRARLETWKLSSDGVRPFGDVYYWGAFILHGATEPLDFNYGQIQ
jgi:CHAT domain-containing protein